MALKTYLNELSLVGQFGIDINQRLSDMCSLLNLVSECNGQIFIAKDKIKRQPVNAKGNTLSDLLSPKNGVLNHDTVILLLTLLQKSNPIPSTPAGSTYTYNKKNCNSTSLSAVYEEVASNTVDFIVVASFPSAEFNVANISITKDNTTTKQVANVTSSEGFSNLLEINGFPTRYDKKSKIPPSDEQSVLTKCSDFECTGKRETYTTKNRLVYFRKSKKEYWYLDGTHPDGSAHYEVFSHDGTFKGEHSFFDDDLDNVVLPRNKKNRKLYMS